LHAVGGIKRLDINVIQITLLTRTIQVQIHKLYGRITTIYFDVAESRSDYHMVRRRKKDAVEKGEKHG